MRKNLLQINACVGVRSTGRIAESIGVCAQKRGWDTYIAHGARYTGKSAMSAIQIGTKLSEYIHYVQGLILDNHGLASVIETKKFLKKLDEICPDIVQLHNIHGYYINYRLLFEYLEKKRIPVIWTLHDCWAFTGHCSHFVSINCEKWKTEGCNHCNLKHEYPRTFVDRSKRNFLIKKDVFNSLSRLTIISVSNWLKNNVDNSFLSSADGQIIYNGVDTDIFRPVFNQKKKILGIENQKMLLGVASVWSEEKGLYDYYKLADLLPFDYRIVLIGLTEQQISKLPSKIIGINRTDCVADLVQYYSAADIVLNLSYAETFGMTTVEGFACGTPSIVYDATASPELVTDTTGIVVPPGNILSVKQAVEHICDKGKFFYSGFCRQRALEKFDSKTQCNKYVDLYEDIICKS